jgi:hypothetical protein
MLYKRVRLVSPPENPYAPIITWPTPPTVIPSVGSGNGARVVQVPWAYADAQLSARKSVIAAHHGAAFKDFGIEYHPFTTQLNFGFHKKSHVDYSKVRNSARAPDCESSQTNPDLALKDDIG